MAAVNRRLHLLSLDGGGIRGLSSLIVLSDFMKRLNRSRPKDDQLEPWQLFDLIGGTSTGGLIAIMLGRLRMSIDECIADWVELSKKIFQPKHRKFNLLRVVDFLKANGRFDAEILEAGIKEIIKKRLSRRYGAAEEEEEEEGTEALEETLLWDQYDDGCKVFVCAIKGEDKMPVFLRSYDNEKQSDHYSADIKIWEACRATSAATTFFDRFERTSQGVRQTFVDGAFAYNNPVSRVYQEAIDLWGDKESLLISIGTGDKPDSSMTGGLKSLLAGIVDIVLATDKEDREFKEEHLDLIDAGLFYRFNVPGIARIGIEEYKKLDEISAVTKSHLSRPDTNRSMKFCVSKAVEGVEPEPQEDSETETSVYNPDRQEVGALLRNIYRHTYAYSEYLESIPTRLDGTGEWLFNNQEYRAWRDLDEHMVLWVTANPGCGKTVTAKEAVKRLDKPEDGSRAFYFFFKSGNMNQTEWRHAICSILYQLIFRENKLSRTIFPEYRAKGDPLFAEVNALWKLFLLVVLDAKTLYDRVFCIIDALDEGESDTQDLIIQHLGRLTTTEGVKFLVTSRPSINIQRTNRSPSVLRIKGENGLISLTSDISIMIDREVQNLLEEFGLPIQSCRLLAEKLKARSGETFLWVSLVFKVLRGSGNTSMAWKSILRKLDEMPKDLKQLYEYALSRSPDIGDTKKVLCIILAAYRPLSLGELNILLRIDGAETVTDLDMFLEPESQIESVVRNLCGIFIYIADSKVHLIHETARDFLLGLEASEKSDSKLKITLVDSHEIMACACIAYLLIPGYQEYKGGVLSSYAARHCMDHNLESRKIKDGPGIDVFCRYDLGTPRKVDTMIAEICDPGKSNNIYTSIYYQSQSFLDERSTAIIMGVICGSNCRGRIVDGGSILTTVIKRRYAIGTGLFFRYLDTPLLENYLKEAFNQEMNPPTRTSRSLVARYIAESITKVFQSGELTIKEITDTLGDLIRGAGITGTAIPDFVWGQIYSFGYPGGQGTFQKNNLLRWAILISCQAHLEYNIHQILQIKSFDRSLYESMIRAILSLDVEPSKLYKHNPCIRSGLGLIMCHVRESLGGDAYLEVLNETWEKAYEDGRHEEFEYLEEHNSIQYLATKGLGHPWLAAMRRGRYDSADYFRDKGARYQFTTLLHDIYTGCGDGSEAGFDSLGARLKLIVASPSDVVHVVSTDDAHEILWAIFALVTRLLASTFGNTHRTLGPDLKFGVQNLEHGDHLHHDDWVHPEDILIRGISLILGSLGSLLPGVTGGGSNAAGTDFSNQSEDDALIIPNTRRLLALYSTWVRGSYSGGISGRLRHIRWGAKLSKGDGHTIGTLELTLGDRDINILGYQIESLTLKNPAEAQLLTTAVILSRIHACRPGICEAILRQTIPHLEVDAFFCHNPLHTYRDLHICVRTLLKRQRLGTVSDKVEEIPQLENSIRDFIHSLAFGPTTFYLNPLGLAVRLQNYEAMRFLASHGANPWIEADQLHQDVQTQGLSAIACATHNDLQTNSSIHGPAPQDQKDKTEHSFLAIANAIGVDLQVDFDKAGNLTGKTLLHYAIEYSNESVVKILLDLGANTSVVDNKMRTALHVAVTVNPSEQSFRILLEIIERDGGKSPENLDNKGRTPYELAKSFYAFNDKYWARISGPLKDAELMSLSFIQRNWESSVERVVNSQPVEGKVDDWMEFSDTDIWEEDTEDSLSD